MNRFLAVFLLVLFVASAALAEEVPDYSADVVRMIRERTELGKVYKSGLKKRLEMRYSIGITRRDLGFIYFLDPAEKVYSKRPIKKGMPEKKEVRSGDVDPAFRPPVGVKTKLVEISPRGSDGRSKAVYAWIREDGIPLKSQLSDRHWTMEFKNVKIGPQPDALFEIPDDYTEKEINTSKRPQR